MDIYFQSQLNFDLSYYFSHVALIIVMILSYKPIKRMYDLHLKKAIKASYNLLCFIIIGGSIMNLYSLYEIQMHSEHINGKEIHVTEGSIRNYKSNHSASIGESFEVNNLKFSYNNVATPRYFFANRSVNDKVIRENKIVRISYISVNGKNYIIQLALPKTSTQ